MKVRLKAHLNPEEARTLFEVRTATHLPQRVRDRAEVIRLSHQGWFVEKIADFFNWRIQTVRDTLHRWEQGGFSPGGYEQILNIWKNVSDRSRSAITVINWLKSFWKTVR